MLRYHCMAALFCVLATAAAHGEDSRRTITVSAQSEIRVAPDEAVIDFAVSTDDKEVLIAKGANDRITSAIGVALRIAKINSEQFKVTRMSISPLFDRSRTFIGYQVHRSFEVRTSDFERVDEIIAGIVKAGENEIRISDLHFQVRDQRKHQVEARRLAVEYARQKAQQLADLNGMKLGDAIEISEGVEYNEDGGGFGGFGGGGLGAIRNKQPLQIAQRDGRLLPIRNAMSMDPHFVASLSTQGSGNERSKKQPAPEERQARELSSPGLVSLNAQVTLKIELIPK